MIVNKIKKVNILEIPFVAGNLEDVLNEIKRILYLPEKKSLYICATSVHGVIEAQNDPYLKKILVNAFMNVPDGRPLVKVGRSLGANGMEQIRGPELLPAVCEMTANMDVLHFFYGGKEGVAEHLAKVLCKRFPGLKVAGTYCPPFRPLNEKEKREVIELINNSKTDIVWVGLSTPKQEKWMWEFAPCLKVKLLFSVGAAFDFHTGNIKECPDFIRKLYLEWFFRLINEPKRLWKRYFKIVPSFIVWSSVEILRYKLKKGG